MKILEQNLYNINRLIVVVVVFFKEFTDSFVPNRKFKGIKQCKR